MTPSNSCIHFSFIIAISSIFNFLQQHFFIFRMAVSISKGLSLLFLSKGGDDGKVATADDDDNNNSELPVATNRRSHSVPSYTLLSAELWHLIFSNLDRNDLDSCERVCVWWHELIRYNNKYFSGREIDYIIFSTKRDFSMILSSGNIVKVYRYAKYFTLRDTHRPVDHPSFMTVKTYRRSPLRPKPSPGSNQLRLFIDELRMLTNGVGHSSATPNVDQSAKFGDADAIGLHYPHFIQKTSYKIMTPPVAFFLRLNKLMRNLDRINYMVFQSFSLTDAFIERFIHYIEPKIVTNDIRLIRFKHGKAHPRAVRFFFDVILGNKPNWVSSIV